MKLDSFRSWQDSVLKFNSDYVSVFEMKCEVEYNESYDFQGFQLVAIWFSFYKFVTWLVKFKFQLD